jgi:hypothetical protein
MYGIKAENKWAVAMTKDVKAYEENRNKHKMSDYESANIPKGGLKDITKALKVYKTQIASVFTKKPSLAGLYKYQLFLALKLMSTAVPVRNDLPTINVEHEKGNYLVKKKSSYTIVFTKFKNSDKLGPREIKLDRASSMQMKKFLKYRDGLVDHDFLFSLRSGANMSKGAFSQALIKLTQKLIGKKIGSRLLRVMFASDNAEILKAADNISKKMLHSKTGKQTRQYVKH